MKSRVQLSEKSMLAMESQIPELAGGAVKRAYYQALTTGWKVLEAVNGKLVETSADGEQRVIRDLQTPVPVVVGSNRIRRSPQ